MNKATTATKHTSAPSPQLPPGERFLRIPEVVAMIGMGRSTVYDMLAAGTFPAPVKLAVRVVAWRESEVRAWMAAQIAKGQAA